MTREELEDENARLRAQLIVLGGACMGVVESGKVGNLLGVLQMLTELKKVPLAASWLKSKETTDG